jgi:hypothetical protein
MTPRPLLIPAVALAAALLLAAGGCAKTGDANPPTEPEQPPVTAMDGAPVFRVPTDAEAAIRKANLPVLNAEDKRELRLRVHLDVLVDGKAVAVPKGIGVVDEKRSSPLFTLDDSGVVHVASVRKDTFRLGQLFQEWNVPLDKGCLARFCASGSTRKQLLAFVNGELAADPSTIQLADSSAIVLWYGDKGANPTVPVTYAFPPVETAGLAGAG